MWHWDAMTVITYNAGWRHRALPVLSYLSVKVNLPWLWCTATVIGHVISHFLRARMSMMVERGNVTKSAKGTVAAPLVGQLCSWFTWKVISSIIVWLGLNIFAVSRDLGLIIQRPSDPSDENHVSFGMECRFVRKQCEITKSLCWTNKWKTVEGFSIMAKLAPMFRRQLWKLFRNWCIFTQFIQRFQCTTQFTL